jgi:7-cyano-7-deazaguanine synthase
MLIFFNELLIDEVNLFTTSQALGALEALAYTHTCYNGQQPPCGECPACLLRAKGFAEAGIPDPLVERLQGLSV